MSTPRILVPGPLRAGETLSLPKAPSRHVQVLRLQPGDAIVVFTGDEPLEWRAEIMRIDRSSVDVRLAEASTVVDRELPLRVTLAIGMPANERMDALVEKATELGAAAIQPLVCERSVVRLSGDRAEARRDHWQAVAASACEQSGRAVVPRIAVPMKLDAWLDDLAARVEAQAASSQVVLSFDASALLPDAMFNASSAPLPREVVVLSGPEGGLSPHEEARALQRGFRALSLGPRVLRADTAPLALLAWLGLAATR